MLLRKEMVSAMLPYAASRVFSIDVFDLALRQIWINSSEKITRENVIEISSTLCFVIPFQL